MSKKIILITLIYSQFAVYSMDFKLDPKDAEAYFKQQEKLKRNKQSLAIKVHKEKLDLLSKKNLHENVIDGIRLMCDDPQFAAQAFPRAAKRGHTKIVDSCFLRAREHIEIASAIAEYSIVSNDTESLKKLLIHCEKSTNKRRLLSTIMKDLIQNNKSEMLTAISGLDDKYLTGNNEPLAGIMVKSEEKYTALMLAVICGTNAISTKLIGQAEHYEKQFNIKVLDTILTMVDSNGYTPFMRSVRAIQQIAEDDSERIIDERHAIFNLLHTYKPDITIKNSDNETVIDIARQIKNKLKGPLGSALMKQTPLMSAILRGDKARVVYLLSSLEAPTHLKQLNEQDIYGNTALILTAMYIKKYAIEKKEESINAGVEIFNELCKNKPDVTIKNNDNQSAYFVLDSIKQDKITAPLKSQLESLTKQSIDFSVPNSSSDPIDRLIKTRKNKNKKYNQSF